MNSRARHAFSLVEVTLALGIAVFCMVVVFGLLTVGLNTSAVSVEQTNATSLLSVLANDLRTTPNSFPKGLATLSPVYQVPVPSPVPSPTTPPVTPVFGNPTTEFLDIDGHIITARGTTAHYQLTVWIKPGVGRDATIARVMLSWPVTSSDPASATVADLTKAAGSVETLVALDRN